MIERENSNIQDSQSNELEESLNLSDSQELVEGILVIDFNVFFSVY